MEGLVGYARRNYMVPIPQAKDIAELNNMLLAECISYGDHRISGKDKTVNELYKHEKKYLLNLPEIPFSNIISTKSKSDKYSTVVIDKNRYSVPTEYAYLKLDVVLSVNNITIYYRNKKIAEHKRLYDVNQWSLEPFHYMKLISERPQSYLTARPLKKWRQELPLYYEQLLNHFCNKIGKTKGIKDFVLVLLLHDKYPKESVDKAVRQAIKLGAYSSDSVLHLLRDSQEIATDLFVPLSDHAILPPPDISTYNKLGGVI